MADFCLKLANDPLNLASFIVILDGIRFGNLAVFQLDSPSQRLLPTGWARENVRQHFERAVKHLDGDPKIVMIQRSKLQVIRFDWFTFLLIAVPTRFLSWNDSRRNWVKHWCGENVPNPVATDPLDFRYNDGGAPIPQPLTLQTTTTAPVATMGPPSTPLRSIQPDHMTTPSPQAPRKRIAPPTTPGASKSHSDNLFF